MEKRINKYEISYYDVGFKIKGIEASKAKVPFGPAPIAHGLVSQCSPRAPSSRTGNGSPRQFDGGRDRLDLARRGAGVVDLSGSLEPEMAIMRQHSQGPKRVDDIL